MKLLYVYLYHCQEKEIDIEDNMVSNKITYTIYIAISGVNSIRA